MREVKTNDTCSAEKVQNAGGLIELWTVGREEVLKNINFPSTIKILKDNQGKSRAWEDRENEDKKITGKVIAIRKQLKERNINASNKTGNKISVTKGQKHYGISLSF